MRVRIPSSLRPALYRDAVTLYRNAGGAETLSKRKIHELVGFVIDLPIGKRDAWIWLYQKRQGQPAPANDRVDDFYRSDEWRAIRFRALKASDGACCLCGRSKRADGVKLHVDHIKPRSRFPELELALSNLQVLCEDCNLGKSNRDTTDWRAA